MTLINLSGRCMIRIFLLSGLACNLQKTAIAQGTIVHHQVNKWEMDVYLPPGYSSYSTYKTVYFNDGEMVFHRGGLALDRKLDKMIAGKQIEPLIVIGIYANGNRLSWYTPYEDEWIRTNWGNYTPLAASYTQSIIDDIIPFIEKSYSVEKLPVARAIAGSSLGGLHATWAGLTHPNTFGYSIALSPSYWVADKKLFKELGEKKPGSRFWFDLGTREWEYYVPFYQQLQKAGYKAGEECFYLEVEDGRHTPSDWISRIEYPLLVFAGINKDLAATKMDVVVECIPSQVVSGRVYRRVNAVATLANGIRYSLSNTATFTLTGGDIKLYEDGTFIAGNQAAAEVSVTYKNFKRQIKFTVADCK